MLVKTLEARANSWLYRVLLKVLVCVQPMAVRGSLYSWPSCTLGFYFVGFRYGRAEFILSQPFLCNFVHLFLHGRLAEKFGDEIQANVHRGNPRHSHRQQLVRVALKAEEKDLVVDAGSAVG